MALSPEELEMLTDEERAGLEEDLEEEEELDEEDDDGSDDQGGDDTQDDGKGGQDDDQGNGGEQQPGRDDGQDDDGDDAGAEDDGERPIPQLKVTPVEDAEAKLADIDKREDEVSQKFEDGDLTTAEYRAELRKLERERSTIERQQLEADLKRELNESQANARWEENVKLFLSEHPEISKSELRWNAFDLVVRKVTAETMKDGKNPGMADLKKAYKSWADDLGIQVDAGTGGDDKGEKPGKQGKKPQRDLPPTLAKVPAADIQDTDNGKWANLDRLMETDPLAFEAALAKLPEAEQEAYLASQ